LVAGIIDCAAHIPWTRLGTATGGWNGKPDRTVANFDEDAVTMAVAAIRSALRGRDRSAVEALYLASTSLPYAEKQSASLVATAADLPTSIFALDVGHSLRSGTLALQAALDAVNAGRLRSAVVAATDCRLGAPGSDVEAACGDGAAALLVGEGDEIASIVASHTVVNEILDVWRPDGERVLRAAEDHFRFEHGYYHAIEAAVSGLLERTGLAGPDFQHVVVAAPDRRRHAQAVRRLGLEAKQVRNPRLDEIGNSGVSSAFVQLVDALESASPGQRVLLVNYGDGADATVLETKEALAAWQRGRKRTVAAQAAARSYLPDYHEYLRWRGLMPLWGEGIPVLAPAPATLYREQDEQLRFSGVRCRACGMVQYPPQRVCVKCQAKDEFDSLCLADGGASLFSYSLDYVARTPDLPLVHGVVDFELGGRAMMMVTDRDVQDIKIDMPLELAFRRFYQADGISSYLWKVTPVRHGGGSN
jgi:3-hydroxy-3-methylglutaryl CoA synthase/uncharacterized OB-fold protein